MTWEWAPRSPVPSPSESPSQRFVGVEHVSRDLVPAGSRSFEHVTFVYLPLRGMGASVLAHNVGAVLAARVEAGDAPFEAALVDWPLSFEPHLEVLLSTSPAGIVLAPSAYVELGSVRDVDTFEGTPDAADLTDLARVWLIEALNPRRLLLARIKALLASKNLTVSCAGGFDANVAAGVAGHLDLADSQFPTEHLLPGGLLPFMEGRAATFRRSLPFSPERESAARAAAAAMAALVHSAQDAGTRTLVLLDEFGLLFLPAALQAQDGGNVASLESQRVRRAHERTKDGPGFGTQGRLLPARPSPEHHAQYAGCNGFQSRYLWDAFQAGTPRKEPGAGGPVTLTPLQSHAASLAESFGRAAAAFAEWTRQPVSAHERANVFRFLHRLSREQGHAFPGQFDMLLAAQSVVNANLSFEWLGECRTFPEEGGTLAATLPEIQLPLAAFTPKVQALAIERFDTLHRHKPRTRLRPVENGQRIQTPRSDVDESKHASNAWVDGDHPYSCSFPDEDVFMEDFSFALRKQASEKVRALETHVHELCTSLEDGLDLRETIRGWHSGKIFVREEVNLAKADIGAIVFRFEDEPGDAEAYSWRAFWQAEAHDNSHLMFYATPFRDSLIGPGIAKSEFGGFAVLPLSSIAFDPWIDPYVRALCRSPIESLLLASALGTRERSVLYVSAQPPPKSIRDLIRRSGKTLIFQGLDDCPPDKIRRLRTFHILAEAGVRSYAQKYIRKPP